MKKQLLWIVVLILGISMVVTFSLYGCKAEEAAAGEEVAEEAPAEEEVATEEGAFLGFPRSETLISDLATGRAGTPNNFNEWVGWKNRDRGMAQLMNEPLWTIDPALGQVINSLAAGPPEYNEDFTQLTINLREGVYWSDDVEFTADDVVFTIEYLKANQGMNYNLQMQQVENVYAADKYTVVIELTKPNSRFHVYFLDRWGCCWIMPKHVFEGVEDPTTFEYNPPLSLGPYVLNSFDPAGFWTVWEKRDDWDRTPTGMIYGEPAPKYVVFEAYSDVATKVMAMARHELDTTASNMTIEALKSVMMVDPSCTGFSADYPWTTVDDPCCTGLTINDLKYPFDNKDVRWALALSIDIVSYIATAFDGSATMTPILIPTVPLYLSAYFEPMQDWLADFTLDLGNGETFQPYDTGAPGRLAEYVTARGYTISEDLDFNSVFGYGWWKYAPDVAAKLLEKNGFSQDADGNWLLPDGTPWQITIVTNVVVGSPNYQNAFAAAHEWRKFGIDVTVLTTETNQEMSQNGEFDISTEPFPVSEAWGGHLDMYKSFDPWDSAYLEPTLGEPQYGHISRWTDPRMDEIITDLASTDWNDDEKITELGIAGLKVLVEEMPTIATFSIPGIIANDNYYWKNWPSINNDYIMPFHHWPNFKYMLPFLEPTGKQ